MPLITTPAFAVTGTVQINGGLNLDLAANLSDTNWTWTALTATLIC
ncbi:MAG: hypothetical protein LBS53_01050 [Synergistaceae bacterium]|jgi:hypothetical protein|nr:hypothetical protein [Synergistaceae bacterium]